MEKTITKEFLDGLWEFLQQPLSEKTVAQAKLCLLDWIGCAVYGASLMKEREAGCFSYTSGAVRIFGTDHSADAATAALYNGIHGHMIELDDGHRFGMMHPGTPTFGALLAVEQEDPMDREHFFRGVVTGYEASVRLASAIQPGHKLKGFHTTGTCGTMGAALGLAAALGCDRERLNTVLAAAASSAAGLLQLIDDDSELKPFNAGRAASAAVQAVRFAGCGLKGPLDVLGGKRGFFAIAADQVDRDRLLNGTSPEPEILRIYRKPYAACRHCHPAAEAVIKLKKAHGIRPEEVLRIRIETYGLAVYGHEHTQLRGTGSAKMSMPYAAAAGLVAGSLGVAQYEEKYLSDPTILALMKKTEVIENKELSALVPEKRAAVVTIETEKDSFRERVDYPKGEPENPMSEEEIEEKYLSLMSASGKEEEKSRALLRSVLQGDVRQLTEQLQEI